MAHMTDYTLTYRFTRLQAMLETPEQEWHTIFERLHSTYVPTHPMHLRIIKSNIRKH